MTPTERERLESSVVAFAFWRMNREEMIEALVLNDPAVVPATREQAESIVSDVVATLRSERAARRRKRKAMSALRRTTYIPRAVAPLPEEWSVAVRPGARNMTGLSADGDGFANEDARAQSPMRSRSLLKTRAPLPVTITGCASGFTAEALDRLFPLRGTMKTEAYVVVVKDHRDEGPGCVLACVPARTPAGAVERFRIELPGLHLERGTRLEGMAARIIGEPVAGRSWTERTPGVWLYDVEYTQRKVAGYEARDHE